MNHGIHPTEAVLIDLWGRPAHLEERTLIGRDLASDFTILESSISRHHAQLGHNRSTGDWTVRDLDSSNGTAVNDKPVTQPTILTSGDRVSFGGIGFYFIASDEALPAVKIDPSAYATLQPAERASTTSPGVNAVEKDAFPEREITNVGIRSIKVRLHEPSGGGGGIVEIFDRQVQMSAIQFELFRVLCQRMIDESHQPDLVRGFVRSSELIGNLPWDTHDPAETNVKQLVRRTRRVLIKAEIGDLIEARQRFGYRLRVLPLLA